MSTKILVALVSTLWLGIATAGMDEATKAFVAKDYATALSEARKAVEANDARGYFVQGVLYQGGLGVKADPAEAVSLFEKAAKGGVPGAWAKLSWAYLRGQGVNRSFERALEYARQSDKVGDAEGMFLVYLSATASSLRLVDASGRPDQEKYKALAARPLSERALDTEARDALYRAAQRGFPYAVVTLATSLGATLGDGNRKKMLALIEQIPGAPMAVLQNYEKLARQMDALGDSYATPQLFADAQGPQTTTAMVKACGANPTKEQREEVTPKLVSIRISKPLADAVYLPSKVEGYEHAFLISGSWEEEWSYKACGNTVSFPVKFKADGLGGARNESVVGGKDFPGLR